MKNLMNGADDDELMAAYRQATRPPQNRPHCLAPETIARAAENRTRFFERRHVLHHLSACADCAAEFRLAESLTGVSDRTENKRSLRLTPAWASAVSLLAALFAIGYVSADRTNLREQNSRLAALTSSLRQLADKQSATITDLHARASQIGGLPELNIPILDLAPQTVRGSGPAEQVLTVPRITRAVTLVLNVSGAPVFPDYGVKVADFKGARVWSAPAGLKRSAFDTFTVLLPSSLLPEGEYHIYLLGVRNARESVLADYAVRIHYRD